MDPGPNLLFGKLAVLNGFLTPEQLQTLLTLQETDARTGEPPKTLGEICQMNRLMTPEQVQRVLAAQAFLEMQKEDKRIGALAVRNGFVTEEDVRFALDAQKQSFQEGLRTPKPLGEILVEAELLTRQQLDALLTRQERLQRETPPAGETKPPPPPEDGGEVTGRLLQLLGEGKGQTFPVRTKVVIGRHPANEVPIPDGGSSRQHARIEFRSAARQHLLIDLNSQNGTFLNDQPVTEPTPLQAGDLIQIGETVFQYEPGKNVQPGFIPPGGTLAVPKARLEDLRKKMTRDPAADPVRSGSPPFGPDRPEQAGASRRTDPVRSGSPPFEPDHPEQAGAGRKVDPPPARRGVIFAPVPAPSSPPGGPMKTGSEPALKTFPASAAGDRGAIPGILKQLADLHAAGALTDEEYRQKKKDLLSRL